MASLLWNTATQACSRLQSPSLRRSTSSNSHLVPFFSLRPASSMILESAGRRSVSARPGLFPQIKRVGGILYYLHTNVSLVRWTPSCCLSFSKNVRATRSLSTVLAGVRGRRARVWMEGCGPSDLCACFRHVGNLTDVRRGQTIIGQESGSRMLSDCEP